jgi:hypothetical protein
VYEEVIELCREAFIRYADNDLGRDKICSKVTGQRAITTLMADFRFTKSRIIILFGSL